MAALQEDARAKQLLQLPHQFRVGPALLGRGRERYLQDGHLFAVDIFQRASTHQKTGLAGLDPCKDPPHPVFMDILEE